MKTIPIKLKEVGCTNTSAFIMHRGEMIYIQNGMYYPTIINGYKNAAVFKSLKSAMKWINDIKDNK